MAEFRKPAGESSMKASTPIAFTTLTNETLEARLLQVDFRSEAESSACEITFEIGSDNYVRIVENEWFHLFRHMSGEAPAFEADQPFEVRAALRPNLAILYANDGGDAEDVFRSLFEPEKIDRDRGFVPLRLTECWMAMEIKQQIALPESLQGSGTLKAGYRTSWSEQSQDEAASTLQERIESFLQLKGLKYEKVDEHILRLRFMTRDGNWTGLIHLAEEDGHCTIYSVLPDPVPARHRLSAAVALMNANYDLTSGNYEMDEEDGELRFRTTVFLGSTHDAAEFGAVLAEHLEQMEYDLPTILQWTADNN